MEHQTSTIMQGIVTLKTTNLYHVCSGKITYKCSLSTQSGRNFKTGKTTTPTIAVGDVVNFTCIPGDHSGKIIELLPRQNHFGRRAANPKNQPHQTSEQVIAANVDQVIPVFAVTQPAPSWNMLDRFLVMAEANGISAVICLNKIDCSDPDDHETATVITDYQQIGYQVILTSAKTGQGMDQLHDLLKGKTSVLLGKSGVGKTSLLNSLQPGLGERVREVSDFGQQKGRHTTTHLEMFALDSGGYIIDTPGIRELGLWDIHPTELAGFFREMKQFVGRCRFGMDCRHNEEPGCTVRQAVMAGFISPRRYKSYMRMLEDQ